jgi:pilus assembly protein CpaE
MITAPAKTVRAFVAVADDVPVSAAESVLPIAEGVEVVGVVEGLPASWDALAASPADLVLVVTEESEDALGFVRAAVQDRPSRPVVTVVHGQPNGYVARAFEAGADDLVVVPPTSPADGPQERAQRQQVAADELLFAVQKAVARRAGAQASAGESALGRLITVLGPKGGVGKTLTTASLGAALANKGRRVVLVDLDLQFGDVGLALGISPKDTISDLARSGGSLDAEKVEDYLVRHPSGLYVLLAPIRPDHASLVGVEFLRELFEILRSTHDYVIIDTPPGFTPEVIASIDASTDLVMVGMLDSLSLKNTKLGLETLELMGSNVADVKLLLNRADSRVGISSDDVHAIVGRRPDVQVPSHRDIPRAVNQGQPIVLADPKSEAAAAYRRLAKLVDEPAEESGRKRRRGWRRG